MLDIRSRRKWLKSAFIGSASALGFLKKISAPEANIQKNSHNIPELEYDIVVCGGGPGGVCAAVAAARLQKRVLLVERYGILGGMATAGLVTGFMDFYAGDQEIIKGI